MPTMKKRMAVGGFDVVVLGAGAAGMMAAAEAGKRGRRVLVLDPGEKPGRKILISGGGRCNFTNLGTKAENFVSDNPHFARSALARYTPQHFVALVQRHGIRYHEKTLGQLFCDDSAKRIVTMLERECGEAGVEIRCGTRVHRVAPMSDPGAQAAADRFLVETSSGRLTCASVVVATGGLSIPKLGASSFGYDVARQFELPVVPPRPALVPLVFRPQDAANWSDLTGLSIEVVASLRATSARAGSKELAKGRAKRSDPPAFREKLLITHRGLSGPATLQISSYWKPGESLYFDLAPERDVLQPMKARTDGRDERALLHAMQAVVPARFADRWVSLQLQQGRQWTNAGLQRVEAAVHSWTIEPAGTEGFAKAEVTAGGVSTAALNAKTMESLRIPGLFFVGEVVDVTGWLGGYNFQWAWASGVAAGSVA